MISLNLREIINLKHVLSEIHFFGVYPVAEGGIVRYLLFLP